MLALLDGDIVCYRSAASCEPTKAKAELESKEVALLRAEDLVRRILHETGADEYKIYIGGSDNFRYKIYPEYKAQRKDKPKPNWLQDVREYLVVEHNAIITDGIEADDALGIEQYKHHALTGWIPHISHGNPQAESIVCSIDKDLLQLAGWHYNFVKGEKIFIDPLTGLKHFYQQLIQGDQSDNIPGYDGKMRPKVPQFLQPTIDAIWACKNEIDMLGIVHSMYGGDDKRLIRNAQLLWIQRKEGDMWHPPEK